MKIVWRQLATGILLLPVALRSLYVDGHPSMSWRHWVAFLLMATCYVVMTVGFAMALEYTAVGNAVILANSQSILLLAGKLFVGEAVTTMEGTGAVVAFTGAVLCSRDSEEVAPTSIGDRTLFGDLLAFVSALGGVGYLVLAQPLRSEMNLFVFMAANMLVGTLLIVLFMTLVLGEEVSMGMDSRIGIFGWLEPQIDRLPLELVIVLVCNLLGTLGYIRAMQYFDNVVISVAALLEPVVAELLAFGLGVGFLPGWRGWTGNALVLFGTLAVVWPTKRNSGGLSH